MIYKNLHWLQFVVQ